MLKPLWILAALPASADSPGPGAWLLGGFVVLANAGIVYWRWRQHCARRDVESALERLAAGEPVASEAVGDASRLMVKVEARHAALQREAAEARFDLRTIIAAMEDGV